VTKQRTILLYKLFSMLRSVYYSLDNYDLQPICTFLQDAMQFCRREADHQMSKLKHVLSGSSVSIT